MGLGWLEQQRSCLSTSWKFNDPSVEDRFVGPRVHSMTSKEMLQYTKLKLKLLDGSKLTEKALEILVQRTIHRTAYFKRCIGTFDASRAAG